jgi:hypothetical protein
MFIEAEISTVFVDSLTRLVNILNVVDELPYLRLIVHFDDMNPGQRASLNVPARIELISWSNLMVTLLSFKIKYQDHLYS